MSTTEKTSTQLRGDVSTSAVRRQRGVSGPCADHERRDHVVRLGIDDGNRVAGFGSDIDPTPVGTDRHAFGFDADHYRRNNFAGSDVDDRRGAGVFVRDEQPASVVTDCKLFRICSRIVLSHAGFHGPGFAVP